MLTLIDFPDEIGHKGWRVVNDGVMGGRSSSSFVVQNKGNAVFSGTVSLENNGGFASVRYEVNAAIAGKTTFVLHLLGDGKTYRLRVKAKRNTPYSYEAIFETTGRWQTIEIPVNDMVPVYRGRTLDLPNLSADTLEEIGFLVGNKKQETFKLEIKSIAVK